MRLHRACLVIAGLCLVVITIIIPWGVFTRYVLNVGSSWPEPMAVLLMIWFSFMSAAVCYREGLHIGVKVVPDALGGSTRIVIGWLIEACMAFTNLFMLIWGVRLVQTTWYSALADFPVITAGILLSARSARRRDHDAVRDRASVDGRSFRRARRRGDQPHGDRVSLQ